MTRVLLALAAILTGTAAQFVCPMEWVAFDQNCYKFVIYPKKTYDEALTECVRYHSALVSVNTLSEHNFVIEQIQRMDPLRSDWYTSGVLVSTMTGNFLWEGDGQSLPLPIESYWMNTEAASDTMAGNYIVYHFGTLNYGWKRSQPSAVNGLVCEIALNEVYKTYQDSRPIDYGMDFVPSLADVERGPSFIVDPEDTVIVGTPVFAFVECVATANPDPTYTWKNGTVGDFQVTGGQELTSAIDPRYTLTNGRLTFSQPTDARDTARYQCTAANNFGMVLSNPIRVSFGKLGEFSNVGVSAVQATAFAGAQIACPKISFEPAVRYQWARSNPINFIRPEYFEYVFISTKGKLYFSEVTKPDDDVYYCVVTLTRPAASLSYIGSSQTPSATAIKIKLNVVEKASGENKPEIQDDFVNVYPSAPKRGDNVRLECFAYGTAPLEYSWGRLNNKQLPYKARFYDRNRIMEIEAVEFEDAGQYQCRVYSPKTLQGDAKTFNLNIQSRPYFRVPLRDQLVDRGSQLTWRCYATAVPSATYQWFKNGQLVVQEPGRIEIHHNTLVIKDLQKTEHDGIYQCAAHNNHGTTFASAQLRVLEFAPTFKKQAPPGMYIATLQGNATLQCNPEAAPYPTFRWYRNGADLGLRVGDTSSRIRLLPDGDLLIAGVQGGDTGRYRCEAENSKGKDSIEGDLRILESTTITYRPANEEVIVNNTAFLYCRASYNPILDMIYIWTFNGVPIDVEKDAHYGWGSLIDEGGLYIRNAQFEHDGLYTCNAQTLSDKVTASAILRVYGPPGEPAGVFGVGQTLSTTGIRIKWTDGETHGSPIQSYIIEAATNFENWRVWRFVTRVDVAAAVDTLDPSSDKRTTPLTTLTPGTGYQFRVRAQNRYGVGVPSEASEVYHTHGDRPTKAVEEVGGGGGKVGDLVMTWKPLDPLDHHGGGIGYRVYWRKKGFRVTDVDWEKGVIMGNSSRFVHTVGQVNYYIEYEVKVQALNKFGAGPNSSIQVIFSAEDLPVGTPGTPYGEGFNSTCLKIFWNSVLDTRQQMKGKLLGYKINYWKLDIEIEREARQAILYGQMNNGLIIGLQFDTFYQFNVQVYNTAGNGPKSEKFRQTTFHLPPRLYPTEVNVRSISNDTVEVYWRGVSTNQGEEPLQGYKIRYWVHGTDIRNASDVDTGRNPAGKIRQLKKNTLYNVRVLAYSRGGDGKMSMPPIAFSLENSQIRYDPTETDILAGGHHLLPSIVLLLVCTAMFHLRWILPL